MTDYNLYGCDYLEAGRVVFRSPVPDIEEEEDSPHLWHSETIPPENITDDYAIPRVSRCAIEVDICVQDILNRSVVKERRLHHDFVEKLHPIPPGEKLVQSMAGLWKDETKRRKRRIGDLDPGSSPFPSGDLVPMSADPRASKPPGWLHEEEYRQEVQELIEEERKNRGERAPTTFENFVHRPTDLEDAVKTTLEAVEDLYPESRASALDLTSLRDADPDPDPGADEKGVPGNDLGEGDLYPFELDDDLVRAVELVEKDNQKAASSMKLKVGSSARDGTWKAGPFILSGSPKSSSPSVAGSLRRLGSRRHKSALGSLDLELPPVEGVAGASTKAKGIASALPQPKGHPDRFASHLKRLESPVADLPRTKRRKLSPTSSEVEALFETFDTMTARRPSQSQIKRAHAPGTPEKAEKLPSSYQPSLTGKEESRPPPSHQPKSAMAGRDSGLLPSFQPRFHMTYLARTTDQDSRLPPPHHEDWEPTSYQPQPQKPTRAASSNRTAVRRSLPFVVVKDPNDPSTKQRLGEKSSSQQSDSFIIPSSPPPSAPLSMSDPRTKWRVDAITTSSWENEVLAADSLPSSPQDSGHPLVQDHAISERAIADTDTWNSLVSSGIPGSAIQRQEVVDSHGPDSNMTITHLGQQSSSPRSHGPVIKKQESLDLAVPELDDEASATSASESEFADFSPGTPLSRAGSNSTTGRIWVFGEPPPSVDEVTSTFQDYGLPDVVYQDPFYSREKDVPSEAKEYAGRQFRLKGDTLPYLPKFDFGRPKTMKKGAAAKQSRKGKKGAAAKPRMKAARVGLADASKSTAPDLSKGGTAGLSKKTAPDLPRRGLTADRSRMATTADRSEKARAPAGLPERGATANRLKGGGTLPSLANLDAASPSRQAIGPTKGMPVGRPKKRTANTSKKTASTSKTAKASKKGATADVSKHRPMPQAAKRTTITDYFKKERTVDPPRHGATAGPLKKRGTPPFPPLLAPAGQYRQPFGKKGPAAEPSEAELEYQRRRQKCTIRSWEMAEPPPTLDEVERWWEEREARGKEPAILARGQKLNPSQIKGPTPRFKYSPPKKSTSVRHEVQYMSTMSLEVHVNTRGKRVPNPEEDEVQFIFWCVKSDETNETGEADEADESPHQSGVIVLSEDGSLARRVHLEIGGGVQAEPTELDALVRIVDIVRRHDPDILTGYEVHGSSWGYLIERARLKYDYDLCDELSRMKAQSHGRMGREANKWGFNTTSSIQVTGRHMINIWRAMRGELDLQQYTMENVAWHLLHRRLPHYSWETLTGWFRDGRHRDLAKLLRYYRTRTRIDMELLGANELISRTSEQARVLGVDFFSVFSRGSQFKVESIMFRIAKPENLMLPSPSKRQVGGQNALECLPLVMEPQSALYTSPVVVLDFQSLYPSVMIAYNYCYSTFLGRVANWRGAATKMGFAEYERHGGLLELLAKRDHIHIAPNGIMYAKAEIRKSLLAKMLTEILETRVMVKSGMREDREDRPLQRLLNNRQLALKLLANVTYGYTSASFSGRMPCAEIADSIVQTGRETLERAIAHIHSVERWGAEVVYGDTDSLFIHLRGRTREQAFAIGEEMARAVTDLNPRPVKLKFEKVYHPCVLLAKKRYVGYKYESRDQLAPEFEAKGTETVRRDGTPAEQRMEEKALRLLFETADLSQVKAYFQAQCAKLMRGAVSIQDFCFAKEVRLGTYSGAGGRPLPPGATVAVRRALADPRAEPQYGERVPYVVITGAPGARLVDRCVAPEDLIANPHWGLDARYYIERNIIPPLERIFRLFGADVRGWFEAMPKSSRVQRLLPPPPSSPSAAPGGGGLRQTTILDYFQVAECVVCGIRLKGTKDKGKGKAAMSPICKACGANRPATLARLTSRLNDSEKRYRAAVRVCRDCAAVPPLDDVACDSKDCPVFYTRAKRAARMRAERSLLMPVVDTLTERELRLKALEW